MKHITLTSVSGVIAAIVASLCCIGSVLLVLLGVGGIGAFAVFDLYRPYLIGLTAVLLALAFYLAYRKREVKCEDGTCPEGMDFHKVESAGKWNKIGVWIATIIAVFAIAFPYLGLTPSTSLSKSFGNTSLNLEEEVTFFNVPLVCNAAPNIGCGSRAKFIMLDLMKDSIVKGAWLNRKGTVMAVVWNEATTALSHQTVLKSVFSRHELPIEQVSERDRDALLEDFKAKDMWYKGSDVDALSIEEAGVIADRILTVVGRHAKFNKYEDTQAFREEVKATIQHRFLSIKSFNDLDATSQSMEQEVATVAERYLGKGNLPDPQILKKEYNALRDNDECCSKENIGKNGAACCAKEKNDE